MGAERYHAFFLKADGEPEFPLYWTQDAWSIPSLPLEKEEGDLTPDELNCIKFIIWYTKDHRLINIRDVLNTPSDDLLFALLVSNMSSGSSLVALKASRARRSGAGSSSAPAPAAPVTSDRDIVIEEPVGQPDSPTQILQGRKRKVVKSSSGWGKRTTSEGGNAELEDPMPIITGHSDVGPFIDERLLSSEVIKHVSELNVPQTLVKLQTFAIWTAAEV